MKQWNPSPTLWILVIVLTTMSAGIVAAQQSKTDGTYAPIASVGHCREYEVKMLYAATDPNDPSQEGYLRAAQAFRELEAANQPC